MRLARVSWEQLILPSYLRGEAVDVVHAPGYVLPLDTRAPSIVTIHDILAITHPRLCKPATRLHYGSLLPRSLRRATKVIVPSRSVKEQLCARFDLPEQRVEVILPGLHDRFRRERTENELDEARIRYRLPDHFILFPGNLEPKKNIARLIEAFQATKRAGLSGELILIGGPGWGAQLGRSLTAKEVRWLGYASNEDVPLLYRLASEVAFPSLAEGFGLPVIEAMASGTIVVTSDVPAVTESDPGAVVLVDPLSLSSIREGLLRARQNSELRRQLAERGLRAAKQFSWDQAAVQTSQIYREVGGI